jgi:trk system potassium uptake protein TrkH
MRISVVLKALGSIFKYLSIVLLLPVVFALIYGETNQIIPFVTCALTSLVFGLLMDIPKIDDDKINNIKKSEVFGIVFFAWAIFAILCSIPYLFYNLSFINSLFEAVSGITTTGVSILVDFTLYPKTFFFFRSMTQWLGGMGIIVLFVAILPKYSIAGRQMFFAEIPNPVEEKLTPRVQKTALWLWIIYVVLTVIEILLLKFAAKMDFYNAICCSFSSLASGGFSPNPKSFMGYGSNIANWIAIVFMFLAGCNFILQYKVVVQRKFSLLFKNGEFLTYLSIIVIVSSLIAIILCNEQSACTFKSTTDAFFQTVSMMTTTGFFSTDFTTWSIGAKAFLFSVAFVGGCAVSTAGGIKVIRWMYIFKYLKKEICKIVHPQGVYLIKLEGSPVAKDVGAQILAFVIFYIAFFALSSFFVALIEENTTVAITGTITTLGNIGIAFGKIIGPMGNFEGLQPITKIIFMFNMLAGRLELIPFLALLHPDVWKHS